MSSAAPTRREEAIRERKQEKAADMNKRDRKRRERFLAEITRRPRLRPRARKVRRRIAARKRQEEEREAARNTAFRLRGCQCRNLHAEGRRR
jgi:hypothetical protein